MQSRLSPRDFLLVLAVVTIWGFSFVPMRVVLDTVPPFAAAGLRFFGAAVPAVFFVRRPDVSWRAVVAYGFAIGVFQFGLLFLGIHLGMPAGLSSLVIQTQVFFTIGLAAWWFRERLGWHAIGGAAIAGTGIAVLGAHKVMSGTGATVVGFVLVIGAALCWAVANIIAKVAGRDRAGNDREVDMLSLVVWSSLAVPLPLFVASWFFEGGPQAVTAVREMTWLPWACVLFMSYFATLFGLARWNALLHRYPIAVIAPFALLIPVSGLVSGAIFLGEGLAPMQFAGVALVLAGLAWNVLGAQAQKWIVSTLD